MGVLDDCHPIAENGSDAVIKLIETPAMGDVVNLRQARKQKARAKAEKTSDSIGRKNLSRRLDQTKPDD
ncbi:MAG TPA: DUF4169 family protein [Steroidobacteraceae bacterium]